MHSLSRNQIVLLVLLTVIWGVNWPVMKLGVGAYPALTFRAICVGLSLPAMWLGVRAQGLPLAVPRRHWREVLVLAAFNMFVWHACIILAVKHLSSGRAAILGYTMPIFSALFGALVWKAGLGRRGWLGVSAAAVGVVLLLWHEMTGLAGNPTGVGLALLAASTWALGTQMLRRSRLELPTLSLAFWMTVLTALVLAGLSALFEREQWHAPTAVVWWAIGFNAVLVIAFAQVAWFSLARGLPPIASTLSVMFIPVLGVFSGSLWLGEVLRWQDWAAMGLMLAAIASVLWPARAAPAPAGRR